MTFLRMNDRKMRSQSSLKRAIDVLVYLSVASGLILLPQLYFMVPSWLFYSVLAGWLAYVLVAAAVAAGRQAAYPFVFFLAILTLSVSLPQPEHYAFLSSGLALAATTFLIGSALQLSLVILIPIYLIKRRNKP
jgi:hypothetical protein